MSIKLPSYPKYKDSCVEWLGAVPKHWDLNPLFSVAKERNESNRGMLEDNLLSLSYGMIIQKNIDSNDGLLPESFETYQLVHPGDIVFRLTDLQNDKRSLRTAIVGERGIITSAYLALIPQKVQPQFINYLFRAYDLTKVFYSMGGGLRQSLKFSDLKRLPILIPPPKEQSDIAAFLNRETGKIDVLLKKQQQLIELLKEKRQAIISQAITKGLNPGVSMKSSGIDWFGEVPEHWTKLRVKQVSSFTTSGPRGWSELINGAGSIFVQSGDLDDELGICLESCKRVHVEESAETSRTLLANGDIVVCITGAKTGNVAVCEGLQEAAYVNQHLCLIRPKGAVIPRFVGLILKSNIGQIHFDISQYGLKQGLNLENVREAPVFIPSISEQQLILNVIGCEVRIIDEARKAAEAAIQLLQERRSALIAAAVTGQIDVSNYRPQEAAAVCQ